MSLTRMSAVVSLVFWTLCAIGFIVVMFSGGGIETYAEDSTRHFEGAVVMCIGLLVAPAARWILRRRWTRDEVPTDERDERIQAKALTGSMVFVIIAVFVTAITLWEKYQEVGAVPVGWMWVMAYGTAIAANLSAPAFVLMTDYWGWADGR